MALPPVAFPTLGWQVIEWIETYLVHGPGDVQGAPLVIDDEEALHICWLYRVWPHGHPRAGRRIVQRGIKSAPKGRAKSEEAGALVCVEALGPVRCDGFDADGDPVGVPVTYPFIRCLATAEDQAGNTYDNVFYMLTEGEAANAYAVDAGLTRTFIREAGGGEIRPSSSGDASKDGGKETFYVADETHLYVGRQLRSMHATVHRNTGKRKIAEPWGYETTTAYSPGERSVAEQAFERYGPMQIEEAVTKHGVLLDHRQGDVPKRFGDDRSLIKALRPGYGPAAEWMDFQRIVKIIRGAEDPEAEAYRFWLNRPRKAASHWLSPEEIQTFLVELDLEPETAVTAGFDGSDSDDHTALWLCTEDGDLRPVGIWAAPEGEAGEGWTVPRDEVTAAVAWVAETFRLVRLYGDPPYFQTELGNWARDYRTKDDKDIVAEWWTNNDTKMARATGALRTALRHGGAHIDPRELRTENPPRQGKHLAVWHFENARTRKVIVKLEDKAEEAHIVRKDRPGSPLKIDSCPAAILAYEARTDSVAAGDFKPPPEYRRSTF